MAKDTKIQWSDSTCNPSMGCDGCELWGKKRKSCYAATLHKVYGKGNKGFAPTFDQVTPFPGRMAIAAQWAALNGTARVDKPWLNGMPRLIFVSDMGDSLSEAISFEYLLTEVVEVAVSDAGKRHIWQWLTKRPARMAKFSNWLKQQGLTWPTNLWAGTSITGSVNQRRIAHLIRVGDETTTRFLSVEPQIDEIDLTGKLGGVHWVIQGGESGKDPRPFDLDWARKLIKQCRTAAVPYFLKQLGANIVDQGRTLKLANSHGGEWLEWPEELRIRELPCKAVTSVRSESGDRVVRLPLLESDSPPTLATLDQENEGQAHDFDEDDNYGDKVDAEDVVDHDDQGEDDDHAEAEDVVDAGVDPVDGRGLEAEMDSLILRLVDDWSELAMIKLLPRAKELYEKLHPETKHGGHRDQVEKNSTWPSFADFVAGRTGISKRTVYNRLEKSERLATLDPDAEAACYGSGIANQIGLLVRIAQIPEGAFQRGLITMYKNVGPKQTKAELRKQEEEFGICAKPKPKAASEPDAPLDDQPAPPDDGSEEVTPATEAVDETLIEIMASLGATTPDECVPTIEKLKSDSASIQELKVLLGDADTKSKKLETELALYRTSPLGELFRVLGATTAKDALHKARSLMEASHAAE